MHRSRYHDEMIRNCFLTPAGTGRYAGEADAACDEGVPVSWPGHNSRRGGCHRSNLLNEAATRRRGRGACGFASRRRVAASFNTVWERGNRAGGMCRCPMSWSADGQKQLELKDCAPAPELPALADMWHYRTWSRRMPVSASQNGLCGTSNSSAPLTLQLPAPDGEWISPP